MTESRRHPDRCSASRRSASSASSTCPLVILAIYAFNESRLQAWPPTGFTLHWFGEALDQPGHPIRRSSTRSSWRPIATAIALVLGTLAALAVQRYSFFGRETISFLLVLPIALPGVVTGIALRTTLRDLRHRLRAADDHRRPRDVLRRHRLQQRHRPAAPPAAHAGGGVGGPRRRHVHDLPARSPCPAWARRCCPARCSPSRCRSTRSS